MSAGSADAVSVGCVAGLDLGAGMAAGGEESLLDGALELSGGVIVVGVELLGEVGLELEGMLLFPGG